MSTALVTCTIGDLWAGIPAGSILEVLAAPPLVPVPFAPAEVLGLLDRRGEGVCALDARVLLGLTPSASGPGHHLVLTLERETVSLAVDAVGPLLDVADARRHPVPPGTGEPLAGRLSAVLELRDGELLAVLDPEALVAAVDRPAAAGVAG